MQQAKTGRLDHDPRHHTQKMSKRLEETIDHLRRDVALVDEPQFKAMFETAAEVLAGLGARHWRAPKVRIAEFPAHHARGQHFEPCEGRVERAPPARDARASPRLRSSRTAADRLGIRA